MIERNCGLFEHFQVNTTTVQQKRNEIITCGEVVTKEEEQREMKSGSQVPVLRLATVNRWQTRLRVAKLSNSWVQDQHGNVEENDAKRRQRDKLAIMTHSPTINRTTKWQITRRHCGWQINKTGSLPRRKAAIPCHPWRMARQTRPVQALPECVCSRP